MLKHCSIQNQIKSQDILGVGLFLFNWTLGKQKAWQIKKCKFKSSAYFLFASNQFQAISEFQKK